MNSTKFTQSHIGRKLLMAVALVFGTSAAQATIMWQNGDLTTYDNSYWGADATAGALLSNNYDNVYASTFGVVEIGIPGTLGYSLRFTDAQHVRDYLPAVGPSGALDSDLINPTITSAGVYGGVVLALRLNIDFSDAGVMPTNLSIPFGDLVLTNYTALPSLNGMTVRDISTLANTLLGDGSNGYTISVIGTVANDLNVAFTAGTPDTFAQDYLVAPSNGHTPVPEPPTLALLSIGLLGLIGMGANHRWHQGDLA